MSNKDVTRKYMQLLGSLAINARGNLGLVWHAGNKPRPEATVFIGNAQGNQEQLVLDTSNPNISAKEVSDAMLLHAQQQCRIRLVNYRLLYRTIHVAGGIQTLYNQTAIGFVDILGGMGGITPEFSEGDDISMRTFKDHYEKLYQRYLQRYRNRETSLSDTICHNNCHDNCNCNRGRR